MPQAPAARAHNASILLVVEEDRAQAQACVAHLAGTSAGVGYELVLTEDAASVHGPLLPDLAGDVCRLARDPSGSVPAAWNAAAAVARGRHLVVLRAHALAAPGCLAGLVAFADAHPEADAVAPHAVGLDGSDRPMGAGFASAARVERLLGGLADRTHATLDRAHLPVIGDGGLLVRAGAFAELGGFDTRFGARGALFDLCLRLLARGRRVGHERASLLVSQRPAPSPGDVAADAAALRGRWGVERGSSEDALWVDGRVGLPGAGAPAGAPGHFCDDPLRLPPPFVEVGERTYFVSGTRFLSWTAEERIRIGRYGSFARDVTVFAGGGHATDAVSTYPFEAKFFGASHPTRSNRSTRDTVIGHDVWVGDGAVIGGGVHVGDGAVIATGAVVFADVPPYAIVAGNPARVLRYRFSRPAVEALLRIRWWDWPEDEIRRRLEWFFAPVQQFVERFDGEGNRDADAARAA